MAGRDEAALHLLMPAGLQAALARQVVEGGAVQQRPILQRVALRQLLRACTLVQRFRFLAAHSRGSPACALCAGSIHLKGTISSHANFVNLITPDRIITHVHP